jgi:hypothetical protein
LSEQTYSFPPHAGTERFLHRHDVMAFPELASVLSKLAGGIGAFASGAVALYMFLRLRKLNRFEAYYHEIGHIERVACGLELDPDVPADPHDLRIYLQRRLSALRCRVLEDFTDGGLMGEGLVTGIIAAINDTRSTLPLALASRREQQPNATPPSLDDKL